MKLKLSHQKDIAVLEIQEDVSSQNVEVLRVGITKLLQSGKNKIILNLVDTKQIPMEVIRDIVKLHLVATELKGNIVLVAQGDMVVQAIKSFSSPPPVKYYTSLEAAMASFSDQEKAQPRKTDLTGPNSDLKARVAQLEAENKTLKGKLSNQHAEELRKLRFENGAFKEQLSAMEEQLRALVKDRKKPYDMESLNSKIQQLETSLSGFLEKEGAIQTNGN